MRILVFLFLGGTLSFAAQQAANPPAQTGTQQAAPAQQPDDPSTFIPPDTKAPAPVQKAPETGDQKAAASSEDEPVTKISVASREVNVIFTVTDKRGKFIRNLQQRDFEVSDNKEHVPEIRGFSSETDLPLRVGLLIDASNSIRDKFKFEQEAAIIFLNDIVRPKTDFAFVVGFDTISEVTQDWTNSEEKLAAGVRIIRPGGGTALYDAIYKICKEKIATRRDSVPVRRAIILLTDGYDNQSRASLSEAIEMAQKAEVIIYTISTKFDNSEDKGDKVLKKISEETGGRTFHPLRVEAVSDAFRDIQEELRSQYAIAYRPPNLVADGAFHEIDIDVKKNKKFKVRARRGYYAPKAQ
jgi:Ca-activated chloride channel homolog